MSASASSRLSDLDRASIECIRRDFKDHHIEYKVYLSNHEAHGIVALRQLGATADRIRQFTTEYDKQLESFPSANPKPLHLTNDNLDDNIGKHIGGHRKEWRDYLAYFTHEWLRKVRNHMKDSNDPPTKSQLLAVERELINQYFPRLMPYIAGHATHPLIHLGFGQVMSQGEPIWAVESDELIPNPSDSNLSEADQKLLARSNPMTIAGLAYHCYRGLRLDHGTGGYSVSSFATMAEANSLPLLKVLGDALKRFEHFGDQFEKHLNDPEFDATPGKFQKKMAIVAKYGAKPLLECDIKWKIDENNINQAIQELQDACLLLYGASHNDFFLLHGVTSFFALRQILAVIDSKSVQMLALRYALKTVLAVFVVQGLPGHDSTILRKYLSTGDRSTCLTQIMQSQPEYMKTGWSEVIAGAIATDDEHTEKLVMVCKHDLDCETKVGSTQVSQADAKVRADFYHWCAAKRVTMGGEGDY